MALKLISKFSDNLREIRITIDRDQKDGVRFQCVSFREGEEDVAIKVMQAVVDYLREDKDLVKQTILGAFAGMLRKRAETYGARMFITNNRS